VPLERTIGIAANERPGNEKQLTPFGGQLSADSLTRVCIHFLIVGFTNFILY